MKYSIFISVTLIVLIIKECEPSEKEWVPNINYDNPEMWKTKELPCDFENIIFPSIFDAAINLPSNLLIDNLVLPEQIGYLILGENSMLVFDQDNKNSKPERCAQKSNDNYLINPPAEPWLLTKNWKINDNGYEHLNNNPAVPHQERIPCDSDSVKIPTKNSILMDIEDAPHILFRFINWQGNYGLVRFVQFSNTDLGKIIIKNSDSTFLQMKSCFGDRDKCACHKSLEQYELTDMLCENEKQFCKAPFCLNPIKPIGHCCDICGVTFLLDNISNIKSIRQAVIDLQNSTYEYKNQIYTYVSIVSNKTEKISNEVIQIVITEGSDYEGLSVMFRDELKVILNNKFVGQSMKILAAGRPYNPSNYNPAYIIFGTLFSIIVVFASLYAYYEKPNNGHQNKILSRIRIPTMRFNDYRLFQRPFVRFENTTNEGEYENITVKMETSPSVVDLAATSAFKNPIFDKYQSPNYDEPKFYKESVSFKNLNANMEKQENDEVETDLEEINIETIE